MEEEEEGTLIRCGEEPLGIVDPSDLWDLGVRRCRSEHGKQDEEGAE
jgi:hypothetical protein